MHYYKRNLGDYAKKAGRLSMLQHGAYTLLLDTCYDREQFPTMEQALEWTWASTDEEIKAVEFVLARFFVLNAEGVYIQDRVLEELLDYQSKADKNKQIAIERETKRAEKRTNRAPVVNGSSPQQHEPPPNHKPLTNNHTPIAPKGADDLFQRFWSSYPNKKNKKAAERAWQRLKIVDNDVRIPAMREGLASWKASDEWSKEGGQFIPHASSWLNGERWKDELPKPHTGLVI